MTESELIKLVKDTVRREFAQSLMGIITGTDDPSLASIQRFVTDSPIDGLRLMRPYGFASRPPPGVECTVAPINSDPSHLVVLNDFDKGNRPDIASGETAVYASSDRQSLIYWDAAGNIRIGSLVAESPMVLGDVMKTFCDQFIMILETVLNAISTGPIAVTSTPGNPAPTNPVVVSAIGTAISSLNTLKSQFVDTSSTNFLSLLNFTEKGD